MASATAGFKSLRTHVQAAKDGVSPDCQHDDEDEWDDSQATQNRTDAEATLRHNQERLWQEEQHLNALRVVLVKEQRALQERERAVRSAERLVQDATDRVADKESQLDERVAEIARLEARLHDALTQHQMPPSPPPIIPAIDNWDEREALLDLREQELALARERLEAREKHITTKERIQGDKEAEFELSRTRALAVEQAVACRQQRCEGMGRELEAERVRQSVELMSQREQLLSWESALSARETTLSPRESMLATRESEQSIRESEYADRESALVEREAQVVRAEEAMRVLHDQHRQVSEKAMMAHEDYWTHCTTVIEHKLETLQVQLADVEQQRVSLEHREKRLTVFAKEVEFQHQANLRAQSQLDAARHDESDTDNRDATASLEPLGTSPTTTTTTAARVAKPDRRRMLTLAKKAKSAAANIGRTSA